MSGAPAMRRPYEKVKRPGGGRWGRVEGVPLSVYYELDDLRVQVEGLATLAGANRKTLYDLLDINDAADAADALVPASTTVGIPGELSGKKFVELRGQTLTLIPRDTTHSDPAKTKNLNIAVQSRIDEARFSINVKPPNTNSNGGTFNFWQGTPLIGGGTPTYTKVYDRVFAGGLNEETWVGIPLSEFSFPRLKWFDVGTIFYGEWIAGGGYDVNLTVELTFLQKRIYLIP